MTNILVRKRRSPEESSLPSPLIDLPWNSSKIVDAEYFNFYGEDHDLIEEEDVNQEMDKIEGLPRDVYCDLATTLRDNTFSAI